MSPNKPLDISFLTFTGLDMGGYGPGNMKTLLSSLLDPYWFQVTLHPRSW